MTEHAALLSLMPLLAITSIAAWTDLRRGLIPNWLTLPPLLLMPLARGALLGPGALGDSLLGLLLCGLVPAIVFWRGGMGGGDVKLLAAVGACVGPFAGMEVQLTSYMLATLLALCVLVYRGQLLATLRGAGRTLAARGESSALEIRLGLPVWLASLASLASFAGLADRASESVPW